MMPALFVGHGSPMNTLEHNRYTEAWRAVGEAVPRPRAVLAVSAHWETRGAAVTAMARPRTIHDFGGFPQALFDVRYPAPGDPTLAAEIAEIVKPTRVQADTAWGLDHGTWSVLVHMFPRADVPVVQLSLDVGMTVDQHLALGAALAPLRRAGVLVVGSGNVVHNLGKLEWGKPEAGADWAREFDEAARAVMTTTPADVGSLTTHRRYGLAAPTAEHFLPLVYLAGLAAAADRPTEMLIGGYAMGSLSMTSYQLAA